MENLEEMANELLKEYAIRKGKPLRELGILDTRRLEVVRRREIPMTLLKAKILKKENNG
jgi:hypothetical protein